MKISILIPTINRGHFLENSLFLYTQQTMPREDFEVIILDDDSQDESMQIAQKYAHDLQLRYFIFKGKADLPQELQYSSAGRMLNFGARTIAKSDLILYSDPEVMPLPSFVEGHYLSHQQGHVIKEPRYIAPGIPGKGEDAHKYVVENGSHLVRGLCHKFWEEHTDWFGRYEDHEWKNIIATWNRLCESTIMLPNGFLGDERSDFSYRSGSQDFWGFVGSQAGLSFDKESFCYMGGYDESLSTPGEWGCEDTELQYRQTHHGVIILENPNIQAVHVYHPKAGYSDDRFEKIRKLADDSTHLFANQVDPNWGGWKDHIVEVKL